MTDRCNATRTIQIESQIEQQPKCYLTKGHTGNHAATILDSDDNAITDQWRDQCTSEAVNEFAGHPVRCHAWPGHAGPHWIGTGFQWTDAESLEAS